MEAPLQKLPASQESVYCHYCGKCSSQRKNLARHIARHHGSKTYKECSKNEAADKLNETMAKEKQEAEEKAQKRKETKKLQLEKKRRDEKLNELKQKRLDEEVRAKKVLELKRLKEVSQNKENCKRPRSSRNQENNPRAAVSASDCTVNVRQESQREEQPSTSRVLRTTTTSNASATSSSAPQARRTPKAVIPDKKAFDQDMAGVRTVDSLVQTAKSFRKDRANGKITCIPCHDHFGRGQLSYDFGDGENFSQTDMHPNFSELKRKVKEHIYKSTSHRKCSELAMNTGKFVTDAQDRKAGMIVARAAYKCHKQNLGLKAIEEELQAADANDLEIGSINHSKGLCGKLTAPLYENLKDHVKTSLNNPLPATGEPAHFAVVADKATPSSDTLHIIGIVIPREKGPEAVFLGAVKNRDGSGPGLAYEIHNKLLEFFDEESIKKRLSSISTDGQYIKNSVGDYSKLLLGIAEKHDHLSFVWDAAHGLELAGKDSREQSGADGRIGVRFIRETYGTIQGIANSSKYGKTWSALNDIRDKNIETSLERGEPMDMRTQKLKKFKTFSTTRFSTYTADALKAFKDNYKEVYEHLNKEQSQSLSDIQSASFVLRLNGLYDVYTEVGDLSKTMQKSSLFTWTVDNAVQQTLSKLEVMEASLRRHDNSVKDTAGLQNFSQVVEELRLTGTYQDMPILNDRQAPIAGTTRATAGRTSRENSSFKSKIIGVENELAGHISKLRSTIDDRFFGTQPKLLKWARNVFSVSEVAKRDLNSSPRYLQDMVISAQQKGTISSDVSIGKIQEEYKMFMETVKQRKEMQPGKGDIFDQNIYVQMLQNDDPRYRNVAKLLSLASGNSYCESITEGYGSVIARRRRGREKIGTDRLSQEVFIDLNGPNCGRACNGLLESSLDDYFDNKPWRFNRNSDVRKLVPVDRSLVVDRKNSNPGKFGAM